jgi:hypothetical protein
MFVAAAALAGGCRGRSIEHSERSPEELARAVLRAVEQRDVSRLRELMLNETEFRDIVWPELPAARPERNLSAGFLWTDLRQKSEGNLDRLLNEYGGQSYRLVSVRFTGGTSQYRTYLVHRSAAVETRDADGHAQTLRLFGSVIQRGRGFKVFSYVVD